VGSGTRPTQRKKKKKKEEKKALVRQNITALKLWKLYSEQQCWILENSMGARNRVAVPARQSM
jgi:hypothetical protein